MSMLVTGLLCDCVDMARVRWFSLKTFTIPMHFVCWRNIATATSRSTTTFRVMQPLHIFLSCLFSCFLFVYPVFFQNYFKCCHSWLGWFQKVACEYCGNFLTGQILFCLLVEASEHWRLQTGCHVWKHLALETFCSQAFLFAVKCWVLHFSECLECVFECVSLCMHILVYVSLHCVPKLAAPPQIS